MSTKFQTGYSIILKIGGEKISSYNFYRLIENDCQTKLRILPEVNHRDIQLPSTHIVTNLNKIIPSFAHFDRNYLSLVTNFE